jgi:hypothetical protein
MPLIREIYSLVDGCCFQPVEVLGFRCFSSKVVNRSVIRILGICQMLV